MEQITEYATIAKLILIPLGIVIVSFLLQRIIGAIVQVIRRLEDFLIQFNKTSVLMLCLYFVILAYVKLT